MDWYKANFIISDEKEKMNAEYIHDYLANKSYWAENIPLETVVETIISFGVTLAITSRTPEDAAKLLEIMALAVRSGKITSPEH